MLEPNSRRFRGLGPLRNREPVLGRGDQHRRVPARTANGGGGQLRFSRPTARGRLSLEGLSLPIHRGGSRRRRAAYGRWQPSRPRHGWRDITNRNRVRNAVSALLVLADGGSRTQQRESAASDRGARRNAAGALAGARAGPLLRRFWAR